VRAEIKERLNKIEDLNAQIGAQTERLLTAAEPRTIKILEERIARLDQQIADNRQQIARLDQQLAMEVRRMEQAPGSLELCL